MLESSVVLRVVQMPLVQSVLQSLSSAYSQVKGRHPLLQIVGGVAELGVVSVSQAAMKQATPLFTSFEPQIGKANSLALQGLDQLEQNFPILQQSTDEVASHLRDALAVTLDDLQLWLVEGVDLALEGVERGAELVTERSRTLLRSFQGSKVGQVAFSGLDDLLTRLEEVTAFYLPLPPTLRLQWEQRMQQFEDEDEDEPSVWTRVRSLVLILVLQIYHRLMKTRDQLQRSVGGVKTIAHATREGPERDQRETRERDQRETRERPERETRERPERETRERPERDQRETRVRDQRERPERDQRETRERPELETRERETRERPERDKRETRERPERHETRET
ncbi:perilipin-2-like [Eucyclogobius newberryi]|uniref:perilipin-2-like n=1 Tax=Eucyclogobius newberryi TaxID=166745 RepID=UPI003B59DDB5